MMNTTPRLAHHFVDMCFLFYEKTSPTEQELKRTGSLFTEYGFKLSTEQVDDVTRIIKFARFMNTERENKPGSIRHKLYNKSSESHRKGRSAKEVKEDNIAAVMESDSKLEAHRISRLRKYEESIAEIDSAKKVIQLTAAFNGLDISGITLTINQKEKGKRNKVLVTITELNRELLMSFLLGSENYLISKKAIFENPIPPAPETSYFTAQSKEDFLCDIVDYSNEELGMMLSPEFKITPQIKLFTGLILSEGGWMLNKADFDAQNKRNFKGYDYEGKFETYLKKTSPLNKLKHAEPLAVTMNRLIENLDQESNKASDIE